MRLPIFLHLIMQLIMSFVLRLGELDAKRVSHYGRPGLGFVLVSIYQWLSSPLGSLDVDLESREKDACMTRFWHTGHRCIGDCKAN